MKHPRVSLFALLLALAPLLALGQVPSQPAVPPPVAVQPLPGGEPIARPQPPAQWNAAQVRRAFELADSDSNGELTRAEAQRLIILPNTFEQIDQNKNGVVELGEYEASFAR